MENEFHFTNDELRVLAKEIVTLLTEALKTNDELQCLEVSDVAKELKHSKSQVHKLIREKKLKAFHSGTSVRIRRKKLLEYIEDLEKEEELLWAIFLKKKESTRIRQ